MAKRNNVVDDFESMLKTHSKKDERAPKPIPELTEEQSKAANEIRDWANSEDNLKPNPNDVSGTGKSQALKATPKPEIKAEVKPAKVYDDVPDLDNVPELYKTVAKIRYRIGNFKATKGAFYIADKRIFEFQRMSAEGLAVGFNHKSNSYQAHNPADCRGIYYVALINDEQYGIPFNKYANIVPNDTYCGSLISILKQPRLKDEVMYKGKRARIEQIEKGRYTLSLPELKVVEARRNEFTLANTRDDVVLFDPLW